MIVTKRSNKIIIIVSWMLILLVVIIALINRDFYDFCIFILATNGLTSFCLYHLVVQTLNVLGTSKTLELENSSVVCIWKCKLMGKKCSKKMCLQCKIQSA